MLLLENAKVAWRATIKSFEALIDGRDTIQNKKYFVSNFHNAIELFTKQLMVNQNDYRVLEIKNKDKEARLAKRYYSSNVRDFIDSLSPKEMLDLRTCDFSQIRIKDYYEKTKPENFDPDGAIKKLTRFRNEESHFIFTTDFLNDKDFVILGKFLFKYYSAICNEDLLPTLSWGRRGNAFLNENSGLMLRGIDYKTLNQSFTYKKQLQESKFTKLFLLKVDGRQLRWSDDRVGLYETAEAIFFNCQDVSALYSFEDIWDYLVSYEKYNLIDIEFCEGEGTQEDGYVIVKWKGNR